MKLYAFIFFVCVLMSDISIAQTSLPQYKIGLIDLMLLKRQKLSAVQLAKELGAHGLEIDMGGLGNRPTFDNKLAIDSIREQYLNKSKELGIEFCSIGMTGFYAQSFCSRPNVDTTIADCNHTLSLLVQCIWQILSLPNISISL